MTIEARFCRLQSALSSSVQNQTPASVEVIERWLGELNEMKGRLNELTAALQRVSDVNMAFALTTRLIEAAHTEKLDADQVWCLLDPLRERLDRAIDDVRLSL
ncbi:MULTISPECIES: hypothetical protein [unclassified Pseudomonas]|uniref:hypothetical protein n=1 Tax=unclassified Pseudomonas TaxID=196821 RepID=UPI0025DD3D56|nr:MULTISPECIES: hypothetical protein [unclassified Pseudomonas]